MKRIVEIQARPNGAHRNQTGFRGDLPAGWAIIRGDEDLENFPFGSFEVETIDGEPYMKEGSWTPGEMPEPEPEPEPEPSTEERIAALEEELAAAKILLGLEE